MATLGALAVSGAVPATAQDAKPQPTSCAGLAFEDAAGDQGLAPQARRSPDNMDVRQGFFRYVVGSDGRPVLTTNLVVAKLDKTVDAGMHGASWYFLWDNDGTTQFTRVDLIDGAITYQYGHQEPQGLTVDGTTRGRFIEGEMGVVEVVVPGAMGVSGKLLGAPEGQGRIRYGTAALNNSAVVDGTAGGNDFQANVCTADSAGGGASGPDVAPRTPPAPPLGVKVLSRSAKVAKRAVAVKLQSSGTVTALKARLLKGKATVATGSLMKLAGKGTLKLKLRKKSLRKGSYALTISGRNSSGQSATVNAPLRIR